jgi:Large-conductance mechanosensitive channel, MscL
MLKEFKEFAMRGNVIDLAIGKPSREQTATVPTMSTNMPGLGSPVMNKRSPAL